MTDRIEAAMEGARQKLADAVFGKPNGHEDLVAESWGHVNAINLRELLEAGEIMAANGESATCWDAAIAKLTGPGE